MFIFDISFGLQIVASMSGSHKSSSDSQSTVAKADIITPFSLISKLSAALAIDGDQQRYGVDGKLSYNDDSYTSKLEARKPLSPSNVQITFSGETPFKSLRRLDASVDHVINPKALRTVITASRGRQQTTLSILANDNSDRRTTDVSGDITLKSDDIEGVRDLALSLAHKDDGRKYESRASVSRDAKT
jgi:hypothetical protein